MPPGSTDAPPEHVRPMLATAGSLPLDTERHTVEFKWDGIRAVAHWDGSELRLVTRSLRDVTVAYPELHGMGKALGRHPLVLDGEVVSLDDQGLPSFQRLQERMHVADPHTAARRAAALPVAYLAFDCLYADGRLLYDLPWTERRSRLEAVGLSGPCWAAAPTFPGEGVDIAAVAEARGHEGVVAKRLDSTYQPGIRSRAWVKVKILKRDEFVVGGWLPGEGNREGQIGSLLVGLPGDGGGLDYCGAVGTGFTAKELRRLDARLRPLVTGASPFTTAVPRRDARFVEPCVVVDVEYRERTTGGILRQPSYKGERIDKTVDDVRRMTRSD